MEVGLLSTDPDEIKKSSGIIKKKVTRNINSLDIALPQDEVEIFIITEIDEEEVNQIVYNLDSNFSSFQEVHS